MSGYDRVIIAEKPSLARAIAAGLSGSGHKKNGYIECGGTVITWCYGHLLEQAGPERYGWKEWRLDTLPIVPSGEWIFKAPTSKDCSSGDQSGTCRTVHGRFHIHSCCIFLP